jgi:hypothetical protein
LSSANPAELSVVASPENLDTTTEHVSKDANSPQAEVEISDDAEQALGLAQLLGGDSGEEKSSEEMPQEIKNADKDTTGPVA